MCIRDRDLGRFDTPVEPRIAALAVLDHLWERRHERVGKLIVIDEAHNLCPPDPVTAVEPVSYTHLDVYKRQVRW